MKESIIHQTIDEHGRKQGKYKSFIETPYRHLVMHAYYINGNLNGEYKLWHENGTLYVHTYYLDNNAHGEYKSWNEDGTLVEHKFYLNGIRQSLSPALLSPKDKFILSIKEGVQWL